MDSKELKSECGRVVGGLRSLYSIYVRDCHVIEDGGKLPYADTSKGVGRYIVSQYEGHRVGVEDVLEALKLGSVEVTDARDIRSIADSIERGAKKLA